LLRFTRVSGANFARSLVLYRKGGSLTGGVSSHQNRDHSAWRDKNISKRHPENVTRIFDKASVYDWGRRTDMGKCEVCGNEYDKSFEMRMSGRTHVFDSFECAIHALAPSCAHCGCKVIGHGIEATGTFYCCANCARQAGIGDVRDRSAQSAKPE